MFDLPLWISQPNELAQMNNWSTLNSDLIPLKPHISARNAVWFSANYNCLHADRQAQGGNAGSRLAPLVKRGQRNQPWQIWSM